MRLRIIGFLPLAGVLLLTLLLRAWGLTWGLPSATHFFSYHPDESVVLEYAMGMNAFTGHLLPHFYRYGSLQLYLVNFANSLAFVFGAADIVPKPFAQWHDAWARLYLIGRVLTVGMGVGTVWATYALGLRLWGRRAGLLAAGLLAVTPLHAQQGHWLTVDVPAAFWGTLSLLCAAKALEPAPGPAARRAVLWAGVLAGLAAATKYNMALMLAPVLAACLLIRRPAWMGVGLAAFAVAFVLACPGCVLETALFLSHVRAEAIHVSREPGPTFQGTGNGFAYLFLHTLSAGLGWPALLLALAAAVYAGYRRAPGDKLLAAFAVPYGIVISLAAVRYARYAVPLLPLLALWSGRLLADWSRAARPAVRGAGIMAGAAAALLTAGYCAQIVRPMTQTDPRDGALAWLRAHAPPAAPIGFAAQPWFGTPPVSPYFTLPQPGGWRRFVSPADAARIVYNGTNWDAGLLRRVRPPYVLLSEYDYRDALRLREPAALSYLNVLRQDYSPVKCAPEPSTQDLPRHDLPHDMLYPNPYIIIYQRRS